ncbi:MAG TPA: hypothetical protein DD725_09615 [Deltaproteobacteria bacterium]|nr:MAG: hypothetical protein A2Z89_07545 [Deltaproteobacteria bacterium GWA2_43_19]HBR17848.1 hypothetical protein [Deltaproteobacteria bacterium]
MSALIVGKEAHIGAVCEILMGSGFNAVYYQQGGEEIDNACLRGYGQLDMLILMKETIEESDIRGIFKQAVRLDIPVVLWRGGMMMHKKRLKWILPFMFFSATGMVMAGQNNWVQVADEIEKALHDAMRSYETGKTSEAMEQVADAYFGIFEGEKANMEIAVRRFISLKKAAELEKGFSDLRKAMFNKAPLADVKRQIAALVGAVKEAAGKLDGKGVKISME